MINTKNAAKRVAMGAAVLAGMMLGAPGVAQADGYPLRVQAVKDNDGAWEIVAHNQGGVPVFVRVDMKNGENVRASNSSTGLQKVLEPGAKDSMMVVIPSDPKKEMNFGWETRMVLGRGTARGEHDGLYRVPFPADMTFDTLNTADDSHSHASDAHSFDIMMPEGTPVIAARSGVVADVKGETRGDRVKDGVRPIYETKEAAERMGNYIRIMHDDGTIAEYRHLLDASVKVRPGQRVEAGSEIALSGNSGASKVPHLHFGVLKPQQFFNPPVTVPVRMEMAGRGVLEAKAGMAIGAAASVTASADVTRRDPLVLGNVSKEGAPELKGSAGTTGLEHVEKVGLWIYIVIAAVIAAVGEFLVRKMRGDGKGWLGLIRGLRKRKKGPKQASATVELKIAAKATESDAGLIERPKKGYLFTDSEEKFRQSLSIGMPLNYSVHAKVSLHRILERPAAALEHAGAYAQLRGESIDYMLVSTVDGRIAVAVDIELEKSTMGETWAKAREIKKEMLRRAGVHYIAMPANSGPNQLRKVMESFIGRGYSGEAAA